jgi:hypothetical protein
MGLESCNAPDLCIVQVVDFEDGAVLGAMLQKQLFRVLMESLKVFGPVCVE